MRERVLAMKEIWTREAASFRGEFVRFDPIWSYPKPVQQPHPPVLLAGETAHTLARVVEWGDGWFPRGRPGVDANLAALADLRARAAAAGRDMKTISVSVFGAKADRETVGRYRDAGVNRVILRLPSEGRDSILPLLDQYAPLAR
jgi:alkanesulfonate monooxygenase SsuD/methylene tetrahydromethanopterin reductase-like flavin-dependent oxidoreductase (luciferase family)